MSGDHSREEHLEVSFSSGFSCGIEQFFGIDRGEFLSEYFGRRWYLPRNTRPDRFSDRIAAQVTSRISKIVWQYAQFPDSIKLATEGEVAEAPRLSNRQADIQEVWSAYYSGASIVLNRIHERSVTIAESCRAISRSLGHRVHANAYITPPGSTAFNTHFDTHDVIVLQVDGVKSWRVFGKPPSLPDYPDVYRDLPQDVLENCLDECFEVRAGDCIYLPAGFPHNAGTSGNSMSIHISFGLKPISYAEMIKLIVDQSRAKVERLKNTVSSDLFSSDLDVNHISDEVSKVFSSIQVIEEVRTAIGRLRKSAIDDLSAQISPVLDDSWLNDQEIHWRKESYFSIERSGESHTVLHNGSKATRLTSDDLALVEEIRSEQTVSASQLHSRFENAPSLIRRLSALGLVRIG